MKKLTGFPKNTVQGFTIVELMLVVAILGIVVALAVPSYNRTMTNAKLTKATSGFNDAIVFARSEAAIRGVQVNLSPITLPAPIGASWANGWQVTLNDPAPSTVLKVFDDIDDLTVTNIGSMSFLETGRRNDLGVNGPTFNLIFCDASGVGRQLAINVTGGVRETRIDTGCVVN